MWLISGCLVRLCSTLFFIIARVLHNVAVEPSLAATKEPPTRARPQPIDCTLLAIATSVSLSSITVPKSILSRLSSHMLCTIIVRQIMFYIYQHPWVLRGGRWYWTFSEVHRMLARCLFLSTLVQKQTISRFDWLVAQSMRWKTARLVKFRCKSSKICFNALLQSCIQKLVEKFPKRSFQVKTTLQWRRWYWGTLPLQKVRAICRLTCHKLPTMLPLVISPFLQALHPSQ